MLRPAALLLANALALAGLATAAEADRLYLRDGRTQEVFAVEAESADEVVFKNTEQAQPSKRKAKEIARVVYGGMLAEDGAWAQAMASRDLGRYADAAESFAQIATGAKEWQQVYARLAQADCLELLAKFEDAAKVIEAAITAAPNHRLMPDLRYRLGMAKARAGDKAGATAVADAFAKQAKDANTPGADARAAAVRTVLSGDPARYDQDARKVTFKATDEPETWFHFNTWLAEALRGGKKLREASRVATDLQRAAPDARSRARATVLRGACLLDSGDAQGALVEFLRLDALPSGGEDQRLIARFQAGRILSDLAKAAAVAKDERQKADGPDLLRNARTVLQAASDSPADGQAKTDAKALLASLGK